MPRARLALLLASLLVAGCEQSICNTDPENNPPSDYLAGAIVETTDGQRFYETSPPDGQHLNFSAGAQYNIHHGLGGRPLLVQPWVSFSPTGVKGGNEAVPAGNMAEIVAVDDEMVTVRNNSCGDYWLRVVLAHPAPPSSSAPPSP